MRTLVTGANGFVGTALCERLIAQGIETRAALRTRHVSNKSLLQRFEVGDIHAGTDWTVALEGVTHIVHLAARVHVMNEQARDPLKEFRAVNTAGTLNLAQQAVAAGVRRLVYISTIKVNGERTSGRPFHADDEAMPEDAYAQSKQEAELVLKEIGKHSGLEIVIVRPPLVYGPGVKGNFLSMLRVLRQGWPLPLAGCDNRRSLVGLSNLVSLLEKCMTHPAAAGEVFLASDGEDLSTPDLLQRLSLALGRKARLFTIPPTLLRVAATVSGHAGIYERLCGSLQIEMSKGLKLLDWRPPITVDEELRRTAHWFLASNS